MNATAESILNNTMKVFLSVLDIVSEKSSWTQLPTFHDQPHNLAGSVFDLFVHWQRL